jgi:hypothetical protein
MTKSASRPFSDSHARHKEFLMAASERRPLKQAIA